MKIGIIGAGVSGLVSAKYCLEHGHEFTVFEQTGTYAGSWNYTNDVGYDKDGIPVVTGMYKNLRTNLPKEIMVFQDHPHTDEKLSYVPREFIYDYIKRYVDRFDLTKYIEYFQKVVSVKPVQNGGWNLELENLKTAVVTHISVDAVMICNGHFFQRFVPNIPGQKEFEGEQIHSQDYRSADNFEDKNVVVVGVGPSGVDIAKHISKAAKMVYISQKLGNTNIHWDIPTAPNIELKPQIIELDKNGCYFENKEYIKIDAIVYCTGYLNSLPFVPKESGLVVENNWIKYLYKHMINIEYPTMAIIGLPYGTSLFPYIDLMVRYFLALLENKFQLPSKTEMLNYAINEQKHRVDNLGWPAHYAHRTYDCGETLAHDLATEARIKPIPEVLFKIQQYICNSRIETDCFKVLDERNYVKL